METTWTLNSRVDNVLWPAGTSTLVLLCVITQKWVVIISKHFLNNHNMTFPFQCSFIAEACTLTLMCQCYMLRQWMNMILGSMGNQQFYAKSRIWHELFHAHFSRLVNDFLNMLLHDRRRQMIYQSTTVLPKFRHIGADRNLDTSMVKSAAFALLEIWH